MQKNRDRFSFSTNDTLVSEDASSGEIRGFRTPICIIPVRLELVLLNSYDDDVP